MSGLEGAILARANKGLASVILSRKLYAIFSKWEADTSLLNDLKVQLNCVEALLCDAEEKQLVEENDNVEIWAQKARFAIYDAEDSLDNILVEMPAKWNKVHTKNSDLAESSSTVATSYKKTIEEELVKIIDTLKDIAIQRDDLGLKEKHELTSYREAGRLFSSLANNKSSIHGRSEDQHEIMSMLNSREGDDDDLRVIPIVGISGLGKTTLACLVFHKYKSLNRSFGLPSWLEHLVQREDNDSNTLPSDVKGWACDSDDEFESIREDNSSNPFLFDANEWASGSDDDFDSKREDNSSDSLIFDVKGWTHGSYDDYDSTHIIKSLLESVTGQESKVGNNLKLLQQQLKKQLQGKKFFIVLDDFWTNDPQNWNVLSTFFSVGAPGSRVIVTTRGENVARIVTTSPNFFYKLEKLSRDESWFFFEEIVFRGRNSSKHLVLTDIGLDIVSRCKGLPLEIKMIGGLLLSKGNDEIEWRTVLNNKIWGNSKIIPSLRLSYYDLPLGVQKCFACCSIFPKDYLFTLEEVMMLWIGEGLIEKFCEGNQYEDVARIYFNHLCSKVFFQESSSGRSEEFVMHKVIHDLALSVSRCADLDIVNMQYRRLSYIQGKDESLLNNMSRTKVHHLRTFLPLRESGFPKKEGGFYFNNKLFGDLLSNFKLLRVLSLSGYVISELPDSVGDMKLLRYLDLSCTDIDHLPDNICRLYSLQILLLSGCRNLKRLPSEVCNLVNLRHLYIDGTNLKEMPDGIGRMKNIQTLSSYVLGEGKSKQMREFKELVHLQGKLLISGLNNVKDPQDVVFAGFKRKKGLEELVLEWETIDDEKDLDATEALKNFDWLIREVRRKRGCEQDEKVLDAIEAHKNLKSLTIKGYGGKRLSDWIVGVSPSFTAMVSLCIINCFNCEALPPLGNLPFLKHLEMLRLNRVESFGEEFYGDSDTNSFQSLEKLTVDGMKALKTWCFPGGGRVAFKMLDDLTIRNCCNLKKIPHCFPSLTQLFIGYCDSLLEICSADEEGSNSITPCQHHPFQSIRIFSCHRLIKIPNSFTNSDNFEIDRCQNLVSGIRLQHVRKLSLTDNGNSLQARSPLQYCRYDLMEELTVYSSLSDFHNAETYRCTSLKRLELTIPRRSKFSFDEVRIRLPPNLSDFTIRGSDNTLHYDIRNLMAEISNLRSLTKLDLSGLASGSFPDVDLPSTLKSQLAIALQSKAFQANSSVAVAEVSRSCGLNTVVSSSVYRQPSQLWSLFRLYILITVVVSMSCQTATTLHTLHIERCPELSVTGDGFPVNLRSLDIIFCGKMKPFINMVVPTLTSLTHLHLEGFQDISSLDHCLVESIQTLTIKSFPRLESLSRALQNLKHLRHLDVKDCPLVNPKSWTVLQKEAPSKAVGTGDIYY
uniref:Uncharacterized protein n=1 Tax=Kalanchoe fedtschenkoi TaxID=63787 RepID=A0A7N0RD25_KALFE